MMAGVEYVENNNVDEMLELGFDRVPVLVVDDVTMDYSKASAWLDDVIGGKR